MFFFVNVIVNVEVNVIVNVFFRECYPIRVTNNMGRMGNIYDNIHELCLWRGTTLCIENHVIVNVFFRECYRKCFFRECYRQYMLIVNG